MESLSILLVQLQNQSLRCVLNDLQSAVHLFYSFVFLIEIRHQAQRFTKMLKWKCSKLRTHLCTCYRTRVAMVGVVAFFVWPCGLHPKLIGFMQHCTLNAPYSLPMVTVIFSSAPMNICVWCDERAAAKRSLIPILVFRFDRRFISSIWIFENIFFLCKFIFR